MHNAFYFIHAGLFFAVTWYSPSNILATYPRRVCYAFGFNFVMVTHRMQYTHVIMEKFNPFRRTVLFTWGLLIA
jgi:hypothetical protein